MTYQNNGKIKQKVERDRTTPAPTSPAAKIGDAVGLVSATEHEALAAEFADAVEDGNKKAGLLADLADALFADEERAMKHGYDGVLERARSLVAIEATVPGLRDAAMAANDTRDLAVRETVAAKGEQVRLNREVARLTEANAALSDDVERLRARGEENWELLKIARNRLPALEKRIAAMQSDYDAAMNEVQVWRDRSRASVEAFRRFVAAICPNCKSRGTLACDACIAHPIMPAIESPADATTKVAAVPQVAAAPVEDPPTPEELPAPIPDEKG